MDVRPCSIITACFSTATDLLRDLGISLHNSLDFLQTKELNFIPDLCSLILCGLPLLLVFPLPPSPTNFFKSSFSHLFAQHHLDLTKIKRIFTLAYLLFHSTTITIPPTCITTSCTSATSSPFMSLGCISIKTKIKIRLK